VATLAVMAWRVIDPGLDPAGRAVIDRHRGRLGRQPGIAFFPGAADALAAAVDWQASSAATGAVAVNVAELPGSDPESSGVLRSTRAIADSGEPGAILATEIVRLLLPDPEHGSWSDEVVPAPGQLAVHRFLWSPPPTGTITVVVAEDAAIIRAGIVSLLQADGMTVVAEAADYESLLDTARSTRPQLLITDIRMPPGQGDEGLRAARLLRAEQPQLSVLVLSQHVQASAAADLLTGQTSGIGYLLKERVTALDEFLSAARTVAAGGTVIDPMITSELLSRRRAVDHFAVLADRERDVLELMAQGLSNSAIAGQLALSSRTVESHVRSIMTKLDLWEDPAGNRRVQAVIRWLDQH
jgi:DNA-binding NarL/FixJ family response regulator